MHPLRRLDLPRRRRLWHLSSIRFAGALFELLMISGFVSGVYLASVVWKNRNLVVRVGKNGWPDEMLFEAFQQSRNYRSI